jgi:hypothetical protein
MTTIHRATSSGSLETAEKALRAAIHAWSHPGRVMDAPVREFVTVSRQPGAGAISFSHRLAARLNRGGGSDWSAWDRELVGKLIAPETFSLTVNSAEVSVEELVESVVSVIRTRERKARCAWEGREGSGELSDSCVAGVERALR